MHTLLLGPHRSAADGTAVGYRVTHNDLRQAWSQHLQAAEAQELRQL